MENLILFICKICLYEKRYYKDCEKVKKDYEKIFEIYLNLKYK